MAPWQFHTNRVVHGEARRTRVRRTARSTTVALLLIMLTVTSLTTIPPASANGIGGYLQNWGFENGSNVSPWQWYFLNGAFGQAANFNAHSGAWSALIEPGTQAGGYAAIQQPISGWTVGTTYHLSAWIFTNGNTAYLDWWTPQARHQNCGSTSSVTYKFVECIFTVPSGTTYLNVQVNITGSNAYAYVDDFSLTRYGYSWSGSQFNTPNIGASANITAYNPFVYHDTSIDMGSSEWVMALNSTHYIQAGWMKRSGFPDSVPHSFVEFTSQACPPNPFCRYYSGPIGTTTHNYSIAFSGSLWVGYVDGAAIGWGNASEIGMNQASAAQYTGEAFDTAVDVGGISATSPVRLDYLNFVSPSGQTFQQNSTTAVPLSMGSDTNYHVQEGWDGLTYVKNWTDPHH